MYPFSQFDTFLKHTFPDIGKNKRGLFTRLLYEVSRREKLNPQALLKEKWLTQIVRDEKLNAPVKLRHFKQALLKIRYPLASQLEPDFSFYQSPLPKESFPAGKVKPNFYPENIFIEEGVKKASFSERFCSYFPQAKKKIIADISAYRSLRKRNFSQAKKDVFLVKEKFDFFKKCPCTREHKSCNYFIFNLGFGCPFDCSYCYLQHYTNFPGMIFPVNAEDYLARFGAFLKQNSFTRIGTGEFSDSLALDKFTEYSKALVPFFAEQKVNFELKTKSKAIENLLALNPKGKVVISWSLNPEIVIKEEEPGTATLLERFLAAKKCQQAGYRIGFHFDPIIFFSGWEAYYRKVVDELFDNIAAPAWISLGTLRFNPSLKSVIEARFPKTDIIYGELILGIHKKIT